jgi:hypothetical protein
MAHKNSFDRFAGTSATFPGTQNHQLFTLPKKEIYIFNKKMVATSEKTDGSHH